MVLRSTKKTISKPEPQPKVVLKVKDKTQKKPVKPVNAADQHPQRSLDMCLLLDCTASMQTWIERSKDTLQKIIANVKADFKKGLKVRVAFVGYRDVNDARRFEVLDFTQNLDHATKFIASMEATGGDDPAEDVQGGLQQALNLSWDPNTAKQAFLICDAPGHGRDIADEW